MTMFSKRVCFTVTLIAFTSIAKEHYKFSLGRQAVFLCQVKGNENLRIPGLEDHEFLQSKDFFEKPRLYTFQMGSRLSNQK